MTTRYEALNRDHGLCTSVAKAPYENSMIVITITLAWQAGDPLQFASRTEEDWTDLVDGPSMDFAQYRYRTRKESRHHVRTV